MRLNLSDAVEDLAPIKHPPCFHNRDSWWLYLKSAAATQNHRSNQKVIVIGEDGQPRFNERLNYCADCTQAKSLEMLAQGRCDPHHLSDELDRPDSAEAAAVEPVKVGPERRPVPTPIAPLVLPGDAFARLAGYLLAPGHKPMAWGRT